MTEAQYGPEGAAWVSPEGAARIALQHALTSAAGLARNDRTEPSVYSVRDASENPNRYYRTHEEQPAWHVSLPWFDGQDGTMLRSDRIIVVAKQDGRVLYDGPALNEG